jgi:hypothetical protein
VFLRAIVFRGTTSFREEVKPSAPCREILRHAKDPMRYGRDTDRQISRHFYLSVSQLLCQVCLLQPVQKPLVDESGMITTHMGSTVEENMVAVV